MKRRLCVSLLSVLFLLACNKSQRPVAAEQPVASARISACGREIVTIKPIKAGETGIILPAGTTLCISRDNLEVQVELPPGYAFAGDRALPIYATYTCLCSQLNSACQVFYAEELGFGCLQSSCTGSCTGKFTYRGYSVDGIVNLKDKDQFFQSPAVQKEVLTIPSAGAYTLASVYGVPFWFVSDENLFLQKAHCDCEGTLACTLKSLSIGTKKIYYCAGSCNGCELSID